MGAAVLMVTWFYYGQPPVSSQTEFSSMQACLGAKSQVLQEQERLRLNAQKEVEEKRAQGVIYNPRFGHTHLIPPYISQQTRQIPRGTYNAFFPESYGSFRSWMLSPAKIPRLGWMTGNSTRTSVARKRPLIAPK
jgi:hypothetical protein